MDRNVISVKQLNFYVKSLLDGDKNLANVYVSGEISNFKNHYSSGHLYFSLKDDCAVIRSVMFRTSAAYLKFVPEDGMKVICRGRVSVYDKDGQYQLYVESIEPDGMGALAVAFEQLKNKLQLEGLFDLSNKKAIARFPKKIAIITSDTGAALQDILNVITRRYPSVHIIVCPAIVQGINAPKSIINSLNMAQKHHPDTIIIARGGGSMEDLWCFNDEHLARAIFKCDIPIISAVGHETDFTICDFVSDLRAPTPSAAAELAVPNVVELLSDISNLRNRLNVAIHTMLDSKLTVLSKYSQNFVLQKPMFAELKLYNLDSLYKQLISTYNHKILNSEKNYSTLVASLNSLSPLKVLSRGYSRVISDGKTISSIKKLNVNDIVRISLLDGVASAKILETKEKL